jgi:hypothetical protein
MTLVWHRLADGYRNSTMPLSAPAQGEQPAMQQQQQQQGNDDKKK